MSAESTEPLQAILLLFTGAGTHQYLVLNLKSVLGSLLKPVSELFKERRRRSRLPLSCNVTLSASFGLPQPAVAVDVSRHGMAVRSEAAWEIGALLFVRIPQAGLAGFAHVRRCAPTGDEFLIGLEFREPLRRERDEPSTWDRTRIDAGRTGAWEGWDD